MLLASGAQVDFLPRLLYSFSIDFRKPFFDIAMKTLAFPALERKREGRRGRRSLAIDSWPDYDAVPIRCMMKLHVQSKRP